MRSLVRIARVRDVASRTPRALLAASRNAVGWCAVLGAPSAHGFQLDLSPSSEIQLDPRAEIQFGVEDQIQAAADQGDQIRLLLGRLTLELVTGTPSQQVLGLRLLRCSESVAEALDELPELEQAAVRGAVLRMVATLPDQPAELDRRIRDAFAPLTRSLVSEEPSNQGLGWIGTVTRPTLSWRSAFDAHGIAAASALEELIQAGWSHPAYARSAWQLDRLLTRVGGLLDERAWLNDAELGLVRDRVDAVCQLVLTENSAAAYDRLESLVLLGDLFFLLDDEGTLGTSTGLARAHGIGLLSTSAVLPRDRLQQVGELAELLQQVQSSTAAAPESFVRELRGSWVEHASAPETLRDSVNELLTEAIARDDVLTRPNSMLTLDRLRRVVDRADGLVALNLELMGPLADGGRAIVFKDRQKLARAVALLSRQNQPELFEFASQVRVAHMADPVAERLADRGASEVIHVEVAMAYQRARIGWLAAREDADVERVEGAQLEAWQHLSTLARLAVLWDSIDRVLSASQQGWALSGWPGGLVPSEPTVQSLVAQGIDPLRALTGDAIIAARSRDEQLDELIRIETLLGPVLVLAELESMLQVLGRPELGPNTSAEASHFVRTCARGGPGRAGDPLAGQRALLAEFFVGVGAIEHASTGQRELHAALQSKSRIVRETVNRLWPSVD